MSQYSKSEVENGLFSHMTADGDSSLQRDMIQGKRPAATSNLYDGYYHGTSSTRISHDVLPNSIKYLSLRSTYSHQSSEPILPQSLPQTNQNEKKEEEIEKLPKESDTEDSEFKMEDVDMNALKAAQQQQQNSHCSLEDNTISPSPDVTNLSWSNLPISGSVFSSPPPPLQPQGHIDSSSSPLTSPSPIPEQPIQAEQPVQAEQSIQSIQSIQSTQPVEPVEPVEPVQQSTENPTPASSPKEEISPIEDTTFPLDAEMQSVSQFHHYVLNNTAQL